MSKKIHISFPFGNFSLFEMVLAKMFEDFKSMSNNAAVNDFERRELIKMFQQVFEANAIREGKKDLAHKDSLDTLIELSNATEFIPLFKNLIEKMNVELIVVLDKDNFNCVVDENELRILGDFAQIN